MELYTNFMEFGKKIYAIFLQSHQETVARWKELKKMFAEMGKWNMVSESEGEYGIGIGGIGKQVGRPSLL